MYRESIINLLKVYGPISIGEVKDALKHLEEPGGMTIHGTVLALINCGDLNLRLDRKIEVVERVKP